MLSPELSWLLSPAGLRAPRSDPAGGQTAYRRPGSVDAGAPTERSTGCCLSVGDHGAKHVDLRGAACRTECCEDSCHGGKSYVGRQLKYRDRDRGDPVVLEG